VSVETRFRLIEELLAFGGGQFSAEALTAECLAAIDADEKARPSLNAIRSVNPDALHRARMIDRAPSDALGALHGVPVVLKDNIDLMGMPTTSGSRALANAMPRRDARVATLISEAGAIVIAKTNLSEFSFEIRSRSSLGGDVLNPFNPAVTAGGSSGGAAAAVAAGFAMAAVGTDTGGSIRTPASFNGLVGLRPTHGLIDRSGVAPLAPSTDTVGALTRSVGDAARLFSVLTGRTDQSAPDFALARLGNLDGVRLGVCRQAFGADPEIREAMDDALALLAAAGATPLNPTELPTEALDFTGDHVVDWEFRTAFDHYLATNFREGAPGSLADILSSGAFLPDYADVLARRVAVDDLNSDAYRQVLARHARVRQALSVLFERHGLDVLVYPTAAVIPTSLDNPAGGWAPELAACSGWPAITLPVAQSRSGVPIGLEMLSRPYGEERLLGIAGALERLIDKRWLPPERT
jgi:Asp-tRNA(Asn)/Glu-tRNA(Gln) amidotransferase A subunit family amidase